MIRLRQREVLLVRRACCEDELQPAVRERCANARDHLRESRAGPADLHTMLMRHSRVHSTRWSKKLWHIPRTAAHSCTAAFSSVASSHLDTATLQRLERVAHRVTTNASICDRHGDDESHHKSVPPSAVVYAHSTAEVQEIIRVCSETRTPLISFGSGTSLEGHIQAIHGGVCLDLSEMNHVIEVNEEDLDCRVQAGVTRKALNEHLRATGLTFSVDPGADASIGGMAACGASGTTAVKYGTMRENTLGLTAVLASGEVRPEQMGSPLCNDGFASCP